VYRILIKVLFIRGSDWTNQREKEIILKLKTSEENASEESAPEGKCSWRHVIRSKFIRTISSEATSPEALERWQSTLYEMYNH